jgi:hypothetical protein
MRIVFPPTSRHGLKHYYGTHSLTKEARNNKYIFVENVTIIYKPLIMAYISTHCKHLEFLGTGQRFGS